MTDERDEALRLEARKLLEQVGATPVGMIDWAFQITEDETVDLIRLVRAQPQGEPIDTVCSVGLVCSTDDKGGFSGILSPGFKVPSHKFYVWASPNASPPAQAAPEEYVLVPKEPTPIWISELIRLDSQIEALNMPEKFAADVIRDVLSAAPKPGGNG